LLEPTLLTKKGSTEASLFFESGAGDESRTRDLNLGKVALYQLSYSRTSFDVFAAHCCSAKLAVYIDNFGPRKRQAEIFFA
jgi:hypothetical protein